MNHYERFKAKMKAWDERAATVKKGPRCALDYEDPVVRRIERILASAKSRCCNERVYNFGNYGGRGISFSERLVGRAGAYLLLASIGDRPSAEHTLDRIDNNRGYELGNLRWATRETQNLNRRGYGDLVEITGTPGRSDGAEAERMSLADRKDLE